jgi:hypothetical protein
MDDNYPLPRERDYRLFELDGQNCLLISTYGYEELRLFASELRNANFQGKQSMFAPNWDKVLGTRAEDLWRWRQVHGMDADITGFWYPQRFCNGCGDPIDGGRFCELCEGNMAFGTSYGPDGVWE